MSKASKTVRMLGHRCVRCKRYGVAGFTVNMAAEWVCKNEEGCLRRNATRKALQAATQSAMRKPVIEKATE